MLADNRGLLGPIKAVHVLRLHSAIITIEKILMACVGMELDERVFYVKGRREPLECRAEIARYASSNMLSNRPWYPVLAIPLLETALEYFQYTHTDDPSFYNTNPGLDAPTTSRVYSTVPEDRLSDIINSYAPNISMEEEVVVEDLLLVVYNLYVKPIYEASPNSIYVLNTDTGDYLLEQYCDIGTYRLKEIINVRTGFQERY